MAKSMSLIMMVFILVPMIAPFVGQGILLFASWRSIFGVLLGFGVVVLIWFALRQEETLNNDYRQPFSIKAIWEATKEILSNRQSLRYLFAIGTAFGSFMVYLSTGQQVFQEIYPTGEWFPFIFACLAGVFGISSYVNSKLVESLGGPRLVNHALTVMVIASAIFLLAYHNRPPPPLWAYLIYVSIVIFVFGFLFGNLSALALEPLGHIAGSASSLINGLSTGLAVIIATLIGSQLGQDVLPIAVGFGVAGLVVQLLNYPQLKSAP